MITEKRFSSTHQAFWRDLLPLASRYVKLVNLQSTRFAVPCRSGPRGRRGVVNETAFRLFARAVEKDCEVADFGEEDVQACYRSAADFIERFRAYSRDIDLTFEASDSQEAMLLADRTRSYFRAQEGPLRLWPEFRGCGWLDAAEGDVLVGPCLYEIKAGATAFRGQDLRQLLCYLALAYAAGEPSVDSVALVNPRRGVFFRDTVAQLCREAGGGDEAEVLNAVVTYVSEPVWEIAESTLPTPRSF